ncbi:hypothetical protein CXF79_16135 [Colwellia sp. Bg11-28]|nr:hypothetical protein CXF79_16135 [Colwellia sp. Bg11-28]
MRLACKKDKVVSYNRVALSKDLYTRYHSKCRISVGTKIILGKASTLSIVILLFDYLTRYKVIINPSKKRLSNITSSLL